MLVLIYVALLFNCDSYSVKLLLVYSYFHNENSCACSAAVINFYLIIDCRTRSAMIAIFVYCVFSFVVIGFDELFSLWAATQAKHGELLILWLNRAVKKGCNP